MQQLVIVTGGSHGIGEAIATKFLENNYRVVVLDIASGNIDGIEYILCDVSDKTALSSAVEKIKSMGEIKAIINNAGVSMGGIDSCSYSQFMACYATNVASSYYLVSQLKDNMAVGGSVINISSTRSSMSQANTESYSATKGAVVSLTHALSVSLRYKVRVNCISPGWIDTTNSAFDGVDNSQHTVNRVGRPSDIANMAYYLTTDEASFINGQNIVIDGGMTKQMIYHGDEGWQYNG